MIGFGQFKANVCWLNLWPIRRMIYGRVISAFAISLCVLISGALTGLLGLYLLVSYWPSVWAIVAGVFLIGMAIVLRPRFPKRSKRLLSRPEAPQLFELIDRVSQSLGI